MGYGDLNATVFVQLCEAIERGWFCNLECIYLDCKLLKETLEGKTNKLVTFTKFFILSHSSKTVIISLLWTNPLCNELCMSTKPPSNVSLLTVNENRCKNLSPEEISRERLSVLETNYDFSSSLLNIFQQLKHLKRIFITVVSSDNKCFELPSKYINKLEKHNNGWLNYSISQLFMLSDTALFQKVPQVN